MGIRIGRLALCAGFVVCMLSGCASGPHLHGGIFGEGTTAEILYVIPKDDIVVTDPLSTRFAHVGELATLDYLFGEIGIIGYIAGQRSGGSMDDRLKDAHALFLAQMWQQRIRDAMDGAVAATPALRSASWKILDDVPSLPSMQKMASTSGVDEVVFLVPEMQMGTGGDHLRMVVRVVVVGNAFNRPCRDCVRGDSTIVTPIHADDELDLTQALVAVDGGKTWEEQKQAGHKLHDLTSADYAMYWFNGDPPPLKTFMDAAFPIMQQRVEVYFGGSGNPPHDLPTLKLVINP